MAASEKGVAETVASHWLPILPAWGHLANCPPEEFITTDDWVPLYTPDRLEKHLPAALVAYGPASKWPTLTAVVPAVPTASILGPNKEFLLMNFHHQGFLGRQSFTVSRKLKQLAFCPYCGVLNENSNMALSHVRKHLDLMFLCRGCHAKIFLHGQLLYKHMKDNSSAMVAIWGKTCGGKK